MSLPRAKLLLNGLVLVGALAATACVSDPCQDYVDYICQCHADDPAYDCETLRTTYENADAELQDECSLALSEQQAQDEADGIVCATGTTTGTTYATGTTSAWR